MRATPFVCGALLLAFALSACGDNAGGDGGQVTAAGGVDFSAGLRVVDVASDEINTIHITGLCVKGGDSGTVTSVTAAPDSGLDVRRFTVLGEMADVGGAKEPFEDVGVTPDLRKVSDKCGSGGPGSALYVEVVPADGRSVYSPFLTITSEVSGAEDSFRYPLGLTLCVVGEKDADICSGEARAGNS